MAENGNAIIKNSLITGAGRGLFATQELSPGESILTINRPLLCVLSTAELEETCVNCFSSSSGSIIGSHGNFQDEVKLSACSRCKQYKFCGKKCQTEAWKRFHKFDCKAWSPETREQPRNLPQMCRAVMELLSRKANNNISNPQWIALLQLKSHLAELKDETKEAVAMIAGAAWNYSPHKEMFSAEFVQQLTAMIKANSLALITATYQPIGLCLDPFVSLVNHSCSPNAYVCMDGPRLSVRPLTPIKKDEEITISYVDGTVTFAKRQAELEKQYFFRCACKKCLMGTNTVEDSFLLPRNEVAARLEAFSAEVRTSNGNQGSSKLTGGALSSIDGIEQAGEAEILAIKSVPEAQRSSHLDADLQLLARTKVWPLYREPYRTLRDTQFHHHLSLGDYRKALWQGLKVYFTIYPVLYPQKHHPVRLIQTYTMAALTIVILSQHIQSDSGSPDLGILLNTLLAEVVSNVAVSHGNESRFAHFVRAKFKEVNADMIELNPDGLEIMKRQSAAAMKSFQQLTEKLVAY